MEEVGRICVELMKAGGAHKPTNEICWAFIDIFLRLYLGIIDITEKCLGVGTNDNVGPLIYLHNYKTPEWFDYEHIGLIWADKYHFDTDSRRTRVINRAMLEDNYGSYSEMEIDEMKKFVTVRRGYEFGVMKPGHK